MKCVLIVDDNELFCSLIACILVKLGYQVKTAGTGAEAKAVMRETSVDLVLLDHILPDLDGLDLLAIFRIDYPDLPIIMTTGQDLDEGFMQGLVAGRAFAYISKVAVYSRILPSVEQALSVRPTAACACA
ncbi:MAG: response regulator [Chloroflexi bacterium]|nr:response regulator [Chloroflexota bacterium]